MWPSPPNKWFSCFCTAPVPSLSCRRRPKIGQQFPPYSRGNIVTASLQAMAPNGPSSNVTYHHSALGRACARTWFNASRVIVSPITCYRITYHVIHVLPRDFSVQFHLAYCNSAFGLNDKKRIFWLDNKRNHLYAHYNPMTRTQVWYLMQ